MTLRMQLVREYEHTSPLSACAFDRTGHNAFAGAWERNLIRWDLQSGVKTLIPGPLSWVNALAVPTSNQFLLASDCAGQLLCWSLRDDPIRLIWSAEAHHGPAKAVACSSDEHRVVTGGADGMVRLWDLSQGALIRSFAGFSDHVEAVAFHPDGQHLLATGRDCVIKGWHLESGREAISFPLDGLKAHSATQDIEYGGGRDLAFSHDGRILACCGRAGYSRPASLLLFDIASGRQIQQLTATSPDSINYATAFHPDGSLLALGSAVSAGEMGIWQPGQDRPLATVALPGAAFDFALSSDSRRAIVAMSKGPQRSYPDRGSLGLFDLLNS